MTNNYLDELKKQLIKNNVKDYQGIVDYVEEMINDRIDNGEDIEDILYELGNPSQLVEKIIEKEETEVVPISTDKKTEVYSYIKQLDLELKTYNVFIYPSKDENTYLEYEESEDCKLEIDCDHDSLTICQQNDFIGFENLFKRINKIRSENKLCIEIYIPKDDNVELSMNNISGNCSIGDINFDDVEIESISGDIRLKNISCEALELNSVSGDMDLDEIYVKDDFEANTVSGNINALNMKSDDLDLNTVSGSIKVSVYGNKEDAYIDVSKLRGSEEHHGKKGGVRLEINTVSGKTHYEFI